MHDDFGSNYRMTEMQAVIGKEQLKLLDKQIKKRNIIANLYLDGLKDYFLKYDFLKKLGIYIYQGWLFAKPGFESLPEAFFPD